MKSLSTKLDNQEAEGYHVKDSATSQQSLEFPTQNELTQLCDFDEVGSEDDDDDNDDGDDDGGEADMVGTQNSNRSRKKKKRRKPNQASPINLKKIPWGRLVPATINTTADKSTHATIDLYPRDPTNRSCNSSTGISFLGLHHLDSSDRFNEHVIGRSNKCDVLAHKIPQPQDIPDSSSSSSSQDWIHAMISNRHCRIFSMLSNTCGHAQPLDMDIYVEDTSGNGTLINHSILLQRGERRLMHTGDTICLINPTTLKKKIRSKVQQQEIISHYTWIFINLFATTTSHLTSSSYNVAPTDNMSAVALSHDSEYVINGLSSQPILAGNTVLASSLQQIQQRLFVTTSMDGLTSSSNPSKANPPVSTHISTDACTPISFRRGLVDARATKSITRRSDSNKGLDSYTSSQSTNLNPATGLEMPPPENKLRSSPRRLRSHQSKVIISNNTQLRFEECYDVRDILGSGTCGEVRRAIHRRSGKVVAVKIIPTNHGGLLRNPTAATTSGFQAEAQILQQLNHPYIVQLLDVFVQPNTVYLVMELLHGGDLLDRILLKGRYSEDESRRVMRRLFAAVHYLHEKCNIVHRDLKPENILCVSKENDILIKLTDFGLAKSMTQEGCKTFCGTPQYFAPEVLRRQGTIAGRGRYGKEADMWSLGIILYVLISGEPPFDVSMGMEVVENSSISFHSKSWHGISDLVKDLILNLLVKNPKERMNIVHACRHDWILVNDGDSHTFPMEDPMLTELHASQKLNDGTATVNVQQTSIPCLLKSDHQSNLDISARFESNRKNVSSSSFPSSLKSISNIPRCRTQSIDTDENLNKTTMLSPNQAANFPSPFCPSSSRTDNDRLNTNDSHDSRQSLRRIGETSLFSCVKKLSKTDGKN